jgi:hypothetical protein
MNEKNIYYWQKVVGDRFIGMDLQDIKEAVSEGFKSESPNYKQKLVYNLLETIRNNDQKEFFYILLKAINKPKKDYTQLLGQLNKNYDVMPEEAFVNFAYTVVIGIMATYDGSERNE